MKIFKLFVFITLIFIAESLFFSNFAFAGFSQDDLTGTWVGHTLTTGYEECWEYNTLIVDSQGNVSVTYTNSDGETDSEDNAAKISITSTGILSEAANVSLHGIMSPDKKIVVFTDTWDDGTTYALTVLIKAGETYTQSDLTGTWYEHLLETGNDEGWQYSTITIDSSRNVSIDMTNSDGETESMSNVGVVDIDSTGIMSLAGDSAFHGTMSPDKNTAVITDSDEDDPTYSMSVLVKGGGSFTVSDMQGKWQGYSLTSAASGNWQGWERFSMSTDSQGAFTLQSINSDNESDTASGTLDISPAGIITLDEGGSTLHGVLNMDKDIVTLTQTDDTSTEYTLMVLVKETDFADFSATPLSGKMPLEVAFTDSSSGTVTGWSWDFGDGSTSTEQNPTHTYARPGKYSVSLTVTGNSGSAVEIKTDYITVQGGGMSWLPILLNE